MCTSVALATEEFSYNQIQTIWSSTEDIHGGEVGGGEGG